MTTQRALLATLLAFSLSPFGRSAVLHTSQDTNQDTNQAANKTLMSESDRAALQALVDRFLML